MRIKWIILLASILAIVAALPWILWTFEDTKELEVVIINKTVPDKSYRHHLGITWLLNNQKYVKKGTGDNYDYTEDYYGFFPKNDNKYTIKDLSEVTEIVDVIYIADTYGVYSEDYYDESEGVTPSGLIYGGIEESEIGKIRKSLYDGATLIAEFNTFSSPTRELERNQLYEILGLKWTGWIGRYFDDISKGGEVPNWAIESYEIQYDAEWNFKRGGFLFVNEQNEVVVLEENDIKERGAWFVFTNEGQDFFNKKGRYRYHSWFDIVEPEATSTVLASYNLKLNPSGTKKLEDIGINTNFPAVTKSNNNIYNSYYFSGDFANYINIPKRYRMAGLTKLKEIFTFNTEDTFYWKAYIPMMKKIFQEAVNQSNNNNQIFESKEVFEEKGTKMIARTEGNMLQVYENGQWEDMFIKGVNLGIALPGKWFTDFPKEEPTYLRWFQMIGEMEANTIRVYTLMDPSFYRALLKYNLQNPDKPLWLLQEIWPEEHPPEDNYLKEDYVDEFFTEIEYVIDAIHGNANISERQGRAYGHYYADVSKYTLGYLVGRELEPHEVIETNNKNDITQFQGDYLVINNGSPTEAWLAKSCDYLLSYQEKHYGWQHPVAIVSWPTLDVMEHDAEWNERGNKDLEYNDRVSIDIRNFILGEKMKAGFFGAYHIYPNYPDFMNNTLSYGEYTDDEGVLRYGGYLQHFMKYHEGYPALVAEFGLATGMGNAHSNPDGFHHGSMTEEQQGEGVVRMMKAIHREGYAGGVIFEWMDEWAKKTWTTESFMIPYEHNVFWHNAIDPEQNYGILAIESIKPKDPQFHIIGNNILNKVEMAGDESYLYIDIYTNGKVDLKNNRLIIGIDTYDPLRGSFTYDKEIDLLSPTGMEFLVELTDNEGKLLVIPEYNIARYSFSSVVNSSGAFEEINPIINSRRITKSGRIIEEIRQDGSRLNYGDFTGSYNNWNHQGSTINLRLPWGRLNVTDPTTYQVLDDDGQYNNYPGRDLLKTITTDGIIITLVLVNENNQVIDQLPNRFDEVLKPFLWESWGEPRYRERLKNSYYIIKDYFNSFR